jgi:hypothetical protein
MKHPKRRKAAAVIKDYVLNLKKEAGNFHFFM